VLLTIRSNRLKKKLTNYLKIWIKGNKMFDWFKKSNYNNVVKFPGPVPYIETPAPEVKDPIIYYSIGPTDNNRISFKMGHSSITMNKAGAQAVIDLLTVAMNQLTDEDKEE